MSYAFTDSTTMLRRNLRRMRRNPGMTLFVAGIPIVLLLLFVYVFGGSIETGSDRYVDYLFGGHGGDPRRDAGVITGGADVLDFRPRPGVDPQHGTAASRLVVRENTG